MISFLEAIFITIFGILDSGTAFIVNMFILVSGVRSLRTGRRRNPPDLIQLIVGVVNIVLQGLLVSQGLMAMFFVSLYFIREFFVPTMVLTLTLMYFTYWLTSWLCIYYCVTICNFNHPFFVWSKRSIPLYLPQLLLLSAVGCFLVSLPAIWTASVEVTLQSPVNDTLDPIFISGAFIFPSFYIQIASFMGCCLPFILILISIMVTVSSLSRHVLKMRQKESGLSQANDQVHINAIKTMCGFLTISIIFYINENLFFSTSPNPRDPGIIVCWLIFMSFPTAESLVIIFANPKLRNEFLVKFRCFQRQV